MIQHFKQKINIKYFMVVYTGGLLIFSSWALGDFSRLWKGLLIVIFYALFDLLWTYSRDHIWYVPVSSWISGFILSLVAIPNPPIIIAVLFALIAVSSKQLFWLGKTRHIFNPAALSLGFSSLFFPSVSWWGVAWGTTPLLIVSVIGIFILWKQNRWHVAIPFFLSYAIFLSILFLWNGIPIESLFKFISPQIIDGTTIFFATVMLIEPLSSQFPRKSDRIIYGILVGLFAVLITYFSGLWNWPNQDPLIYGLLLGNLAASIFFLPSRKPTPVTA